MFWLATLAVFLLILAAWFVRALAYRHKLRSLSANLTRYSAENGALPTTADDRIVLFGDEVAERWDISRDFPELNLINRGITGETTLHLLARFRQDVVALRPRIVILIGGGNDARWHLPFSASQDHLQLMARLAEKEQIELVLASLLPASRRSLSLTRASAYVVAMNEWLRSFAQEQRFAYADFSSVLADPEGRLCREFTDDGRHPNDAGYRAMAATLCAVLEPLLERAGTRSRGAARS